MLEISDYKKKTNQIYGKRYSAAKFSFVIPCYKRIELLRKAIKSILVQEEMEYKDIEICIVSNDSEFNIETIIDLLDENYCKVFVNNENIGMCKNMNMCLSVVQGEYIIFLQDDDVLLPCYYKNIIRLITSKERFDCIIPSRYFLFDKQIYNKTDRKKINNLRIKKIINKVLVLLKKKKTNERIDSMEIINYAYPFYLGGPTCGILFRKKSIYEFGGFNEDYPYGFDYDFFVRFSECYDVVLLKKNLAIYMTAQSASNRLDVQKDFVRVRLDILNMYYDKGKLSKKEYDKIYLYTLICYQNNLSEIEYDKEYISKMSVFNKIMLSMRFMLMILSSTKYQRSYCSKEIEKWYKKI